MGKNCKKLQKILEEKNSNKKMEKKIWEKIAKKKNSKLFFKKLVVFLRPEKIRKICAELLNCGANKIFFSPDNADKIESAMTKEDLRQLIKEGMIRKKASNEQSRGRARILLAKKTKGRKKSFGSRRGKKSARMETKKRWIGKARALREELKKLRKEKPKLVEKIGYRKLYKMVKGNFFRGRRYLDEFVEGKKTKE